MSVHAYGSYRESGVEWLGEVPCEWAIVPLRYLIDCCDGQRVPLNSEQRADREGNVPYWGANSIMGFVDQGLFDEELVLLGEDGAPFFDRTRPVAFHSIGPVWPNNHVHVLRPRILESAQFLTYALNATDYADYIDGSTRDKLTQGQMNRIFIPCPPLPEQTAIAAFLDRETAKIDALVEAQRRLIALLKEKRQAVISHAVTKGLDPTAPMKDSGVAWLGEVPAHWEVRPLKYLGVFSAGAGFPHDDQGSANEEIPFHKVNALAQADADGFLRPSENTVSVETARRLRAFVFPAGSIVFAKIGAALLLGRLRALREPACLDNNLMGFVVDGAHDVDFIRHAMSLVRFDFIANPGTVPSLNEGQIANVGVAVPPLAVQSAIAKFLTMVLGEIDALRTEADNAITLLQERRSALISAAVTGKIDVRGVIETAYCKERA